MKLIHGLSVMMSMIITFVHYIGGIVLHLYTVYLMFSIFGGLFALISFFLPGIAQIYLAYQLVVTIGWDNLFILLLAAYLLTYPLGFLFGSLAVYTEKRITSTTI